MIDEIINKMDEAKAMGGKFIVRMKRPGQKSVSAIFDTKAQADAYEKEKKKLGFQIEDAPANAVAHGGVDMAPNAGKKKKKDEVPAKLMDVIMKRMSGKIKEDNDNNNVVLKGVLDKLDKIDEAVDKLSGIENKVEFVEEKEHKSFKSKYAKDI